jgi:KEOPS complex subunit Pcc1
MIKGAHAVLRVRCSSEKEAEIVTRAIKPETEITARYRSKVKVSRFSDEITLTFEARDIASLRASINSYLSWLISLRNIYELLERENQDSSGRS